MNNARIAPNSELEKSEPKRGAVTDCLLLNVRRQPNSESEICCILPAVTAVVIDPSFNDDAYYRIIIPSLVRRTSFANVNFSKFYHGYCEKKYISISNGDYNE